MGKPSIPQWLMILPTGTYTLDELSKKSGGKLKESINRT